MSIFGLEFKKTVVKFEISTKFCEEKKCLNLGPNMPDLGIFGAEFEKYIVIFEISTLEFV